MELFSMYSFWVWLLLLSVMCDSFMFLHVSVISFILLRILGMTIKVFIHSSVAKRLGCFCLGAVRNKAELSFMAWVVIEVVVNYSAYHNTKLGIQISFRVRRKVSRASIIFLKMYHKKGN